MATGNRTAPMSATPGDGQKNHDVTIIIIPIPQKAKAGVRIKRVSGAIMVSLMPVRMSTRLIATIIEMIMMVPISSLVA
jgi:hypothetical protein